MNAGRWAIGALVYGMATLAQAQVALGEPGVLPILEGGLLTVAAAALVAGIRIVRSKQKH